LGLVQLLPNRNGIGIVAVFATRYRMNACGPVAV